MKEGTKTSLDLPESYRAIITVISGWLKAASILLTIPTLFGQSLMEFFWIKLALMSIVGPLVGIGYGFFFLDILRMHERIHWLRLMFFDIILTLAFLLGAFISTAFILTSFFWSSLSVIGILLSPIPASDPGVSKATRALGFAILAIGLPLKFTNLGQSIHDLSTLLSILGGVLSTAGIGQKIN